MNDKGPNKFVSSENLTSVLRLLKWFTVARWTEPRSIGRFISLGDDKHKHTTNSNISVTISGQRHNVANNTEVGGDRRDSDAYILHPVKRRFSIFSCLSTTQVNRLENISISLFATLQLNSQKKNIRYKIYWKTICLALPKLNLWFRTTI
jgi:hypothetical protein